MKNSLPNKIEKFKGNGEIPYTILLTKTDLKRYIKSELSYVSLRQEGRRQDTNVKRMWTQQLRKTGYDKN